MIYAFILRIPGIELSGIQEFKELQMVRTFFNYSPIALFF